MTGDSKDADAQFAAKQAADDARALAQKQQDQMRWQQQQEANAKWALENSPQAQAANAAARQQQEAENKAVIGGTMGFITAVAGLGLIERLNGVVSLGPLAGQKDANVFGRAGFTIAPLAVNAPETPKTTAMEFLTPPKIG